MKKIWMVLLALLLATGLVMMGCGDDDNGPGSEPKTGFTSNMGSPTIKMVDNFQYGEGYQAVYTPADLLQGHRISVDNEFTLKIKFTAERDLEDKLYVGLVDPTEAANYWTPLTWDGDNEDPALVQAIDADGIIKAGQTITAEINFTATANATSAAAAANAIVFQTEGEGTPGTAQSGTLGPFDLVFSEFIFIFGDGGED